MDQQHNNRILIVDDTASIHDDFTTVLNGAAAQSASQLNFDQLLELSDEERDKALAGEDAGGYVLDHAYQGEEALTMVDAAYGEGKPYALVFMDVRMPPGLDGIQTVKRIWDSHPFTEVVVCTAYSDYSWDKIIEELGVTDRLMFLRKPFDPVTVKQMALSLVKKWNLGSESREALNVLETKVEERTVELRESMTSLEQAQKVVVDILDSVNTSVFLVNNSYTILKANKTAYDFFPNPYTNSEHWMEGKDLLEAIGIDSGSLASVRDSLSRHLSRLSADLETTDFELQPAFSWDETKTGRIMRVEMSRMHTADDQYIVQFFDITAVRKETTYLQQKQRMESIGLLAGGIAHEFNNIIAGIQGYAQLSLKSESMEMYQRSAEVTERQCKRASELVRGLLAFSRSGKTSKDEVDLSELCREVVNLTSRESNAKAVKTTMELDDNVKALGATGPLQQVVMNMVINAYHAMAESQTKTLLLSTGVENGEAFFRISDSGCGIPKEKISHVFDPFYTTKGALGGGVDDEKIHGTGLGLSVVMGIVNDHKGRIDVDSEVGKGTTFTVWLPLGGNSAENRNVLIIDDDTDITKVYARWVNAAGCQPIEAHTGKAGLSKFNAQEPALVLLDEHLPDISGAEVLAKMRESHPDIPVVIITGKADRDQAKMLIGQGANDCYFKPITHSRLHGILSQYVFTKNQQEKAQVEVTDLRTLAAGKSVLIVDDEDVLRHIYATILRRLGMDVAEATNGLEAVAAAEAKDFDLIVMDIAMPEMDGIEAIRKIKSHNPYTPIVIATGFLDQRHKDAYKAGAIQILTKPVGVKDLTKTVADILSHDTSSDAPAQ